MPSSLIKKYAQQTGTTVKHVEKIWDHAKESARDKFKTETPRYWAYVNGIVRKALKLNEGKITFKDVLLMELFDSKVDYKITSETARKFSTRATINGREIVFEAIIDDGEDGIEAHIEFFEVKKSIDSPIKKYDRPTYSLTGSGGEMKVFSMVGASLKETIDRYKPDVIYFTAEKEGNDFSSTKRADLYEKLIKKYIPDYEVMKRDLETDITFHLIKKQN